jgi:hypothetical protein
METVTFTRTAEAVKAEKATRWDVISAIAADAAAEGLALTGAATQLATALAFEAAGVDYATGTVQQLCVVAKFDHESTVAQRKLWRTYGWSVVGLLAAAGETPESGYSLLHPRHMSYGEVKAFIKKNATTEPRHQASFDTRIAHWINDLNAVLMRGAAFLAEVEERELQPGGVAAMALEIYRRLAERQLDAELRQLLDESAR